VTTEEAMPMVTSALYVPLEAKPDKADELKTFLRDAQVLAEQEPGTAAWFALQMSPTTFAIFDVFPDEASRQAHLNGEIAKALMGKADELLVRAPDIQPLDVLASKL
jgi:quinol monooxygenase YgiN